MREADLPVLSSTSWTRVLLDFSCVFSGLCLSRWYTGYDTQLCLFIFCNFVLTLSTFLALAGRRFNLSSFFTFSSLFPLCANVLGLEGAPRQEGHPSGHGSRVLSSHLRDGAGSLGVSHSALCLLPWEPVNWRAQPRPRQSPSSPGSADFGARPAQSPASSRNPALSPSHA